MTFWAERLPSWYLGVCTHGDPAVDAVTGRRCRLALLCLLVCECSEVLILCLPSDFYRVGATARDTLSVWNLTPVATSQDMLLISKTKILLLHVYHLCACSRLAGSRCIVSNYEKVAV